MGIGADAAPPLRALPPDACSVLVRERGDPLIGTAPPTRRWLLLEVPRAWPDKILKSPELAGAVDDLGRIVAARAGRVLFVRRTTARPAVEGQRGFAVVDAASSRQWTGTWVPAGDGRRTADLAEALRAFDSQIPLPEPARPRYLVCTHAKHDQCCAVRGRMLLPALSGRWPDQVLECSHLGGDRFAGNVLCLPDGTYYGLLGADTAKRVIAGHRHGVSDPAHLRGVSTQDARVQSAATEVLRRLGPYAAHRLRGSVTAITTDRWNVVITGHPQQSPAATVVTRHVLPPAPRTCLDAQPKIAVTYRAELVVDV